MTQETAMLWSAAIAGGCTVVGVFGGITGQWFISKVIHKRELEKMTYSEKFKLYQELFETIQSAYEKITEALVDARDCPDQYYNKIMGVGTDFLGNEFDIRDTETFKLYKFSGPSQLLIPDKIKKKIKQIEDLLYKNESYRKEKDELTKLIKEELNIK